MTGWLWRWVACAGVWALLSAAPLAQNASAQDNESAQDDAKARAHFKLGHEHYSDGEFLQAAEQFEKAYGLSPRSMLIFNAYVAYRDANALKKAADALRRYLEIAPDAPNRKKLEAVLHRLEQGPGADQPGSRDKPHAEYGSASEDETGTTPQNSDEASGKRKISVTTEVVSPEAERIPEVESDNRPDRPRHEHEARFSPWSYVAMGAGGALLAGALVTGLLRNDAQDDLESGCPAKQACPPELESTRDRGKRLAVVTDVLWIAGAVSAGTGLVLWILDQTESREHAARSTAPRAGLGCSSRGCAATLEVGF